MSHDAGFEDPTVARGSLELADGRRLAYRWFGADPVTDAPVVLSNHGGLSCALDAGFAHHAAKVRGIRVLAPDRPGVCGSTSSPGRVTGDWSADVESLLDHLEVPSVAVAGWSAGGQYALAVAAGLSGRVTRAALIAGCPPLDDPETFAALNRTDHLLVRMSNRHPRWAKAAFGLMHRVDERSARKVAGRAASGKAQKVGLMAKAWGPADSEVLETDAAVLLDRAIADALAGLEGQVEEYQAFGAPWGFTLDDVRCPVRIWQGDADRWVPPAWADQLAAGLADAQVVACPGEGHLLAVAHWPHILDWLSESVTSG